MKDAELERLVLQLQTLYRARSARRQAVDLANSIYVKYRDPISGLAYYYNTRSGLSFWNKPLLLAARDSKEVTKFDGKTSVVNPKTSVEARSDATVHLSLDDRQERRTQSLNFKQKCEEEKQALLRRHRRKIARAMHRLDEKILSDMKHSRQARQVQLKHESHQLLQGLVEGRTKENVQTIREAAMQGDFEPVEVLLSMGFSANAESAMGLTPLLAACQSNHVHVVHLLLSKGAHVNHVHVKTGRTPLMEAASRASPLVLKALLRCGARIDVEDVQGETVLDCCRDSANREIIERACQLWSFENASLFPLEFRQISLTYALVRKRQWIKYETERRTTRRELTELKRNLRRKCIEAKVRYDQDRRGSNFEPTLLRRLQTLEEADARFNTERRMLLLAIQDAVDRRRNKERICYLPEVAILNILSFCARHWFEKKIKQSRPTNEKEMRGLRSEPRKMSSVLVIAPSTLRPPPDQLAEALEAEWNSLKLSLQEVCEELQAVTNIEIFDKTNNVSRDANGNSLATLDICVQRGENLPYRDPQAKDKIDPYVRVFLRSAPVLGTPEVYQSEPRIADRNPVWAFACQMPSVPSLQGELAIQIVDAKGGDMVGEVIVSLRSLIDQKDHKEWYVVPPTLRQQLLEKKPRNQPARLQVNIRFTHTKSIVLTRKLQQLLHTREALVHKRRGVIQKALDSRLDQLP